MTLAINKYNIGEFTIHQYDEVASTNSLALELANNKKLLNYDVILANSQSSGRGRHEKKWSSPRGNLYMSIFIREDINITQLHHLNFIAICALNEAISTIFQQQKIVARIENKWPNDLMINSYKIAGILAESKLNSNICEYLVIGCGLNIISNPINTNYPAGNLAQFSCQCSVADVIKLYLSNFSNLYHNWKSFGFKNIRQLWINKAFKLNDEIAINFGNEIIHGTFKDIDDNGNIILKQDQNIRVINFGEIIKR